VFHFIFGSFVIIWTIFSILKSRRWRKSQRRMISARFYRFPLLIEFLVFTVITEPSAILDSLTLQRWPRCWRTSKIKDVKKAAPFKTLVRTYSQINSFSAPRFWKFSWMLSTDMAYYRLNFKNEVKAISRSISFLIFKFISQIQSFADFERKSVRTRR